MFNALSVSAQDEASSKRWRSSGRADLWPIAIDLLRRCTGLTAEFRIKPTQRGVRRIAPIEGSGQNRSRVFASLDVLSRIPLVIAV